jgi:hypothetical protein
MEGVTARARPRLSEQASKFMVLQREVEQEYRPLMRAELQRRVEAVARTVQLTEPACPHCGQTMSRKDTRPVSWLARFGRLSAPVSRFVCRACRVQCRPLWICWAWSRGVSAVLLRGCWQYWRRWPPMRWHRVWHGCCWGGSQRHERLARGAAFRASGCRLQ